ncbi:MAG: site-2 protease family protein [Candidatus Micrarchaeota archaeon]|nr:site-2 protease family protein [Candidatus Micrarchaeota archaeon]
MSQGSPKLFSIFGIDIELHWTFTALLLGILYISIVGGDIFFFIIIVLLFACVLVHELFHSITAIRNGVKVSRIILLPIGGISVIEDIRINPVVEFNTAIVGPITSLALGGLFGILVLFTPPGLPTLISQDLFVINMLLGVFNILPAFPMDGGRVLRSYLQRSRGLYASTMITVKVTKYILALIVIVSVAYFILVQQSLFSLLIDMIVVFFLYGGMKAEEENVTIKKEAEGITLSDAVSNRYLLIDPGAKTNSLFPMIKKKGEYTTLTKIDGRFFLVNIFGKTQQGSHRKVSELAVPIPNIPSNTDVADALYKLEGSDYGVGAVVKGDKLIGITSTRYLRTMISLHIMSKKDGKAFKV